MYNEMMDTIGLVNQADPELAAAMNRELTASARTSSSSPARISSRLPSWRPWAAS